VCKARDIKKRIDWRIKLWEKGDVESIRALVETTIMDMESYLKKRQGSSTEEQRIRTFHRKVLTTGLRSAVNYLTGTNKGGVLTGRH